MISSGFQREDSQTKTSAKNHQLEIEGIFSRRMFDSSAPATNRSFFSSFFDTAMAEVGFEKLGNKSTQIVLQERFTSTKNHMIKK